MNIEKLMDDALLVAVGLLVIAGIAFIGYCLWVILSTLFV